MKELWTLRVLLAVALAYFAVKRLWPHEYLAFKSFVIQRSCGCDLGEALPSVLEIAKEEREKVRIRSASRVLARDRAGYELLETVDGRFWSPVRDLYLFDVLAELRLNPYGEAARLRGMVVLDCGAHLGGFTRLAMNAGARHVVAIEPAPDEVECLTRTFSQEIRDRQVTVFPKAVWSSTGEMKLMLDNASTGATVADPKELAYGFTERFSVVVPTITIDELVRELKLDRVDFIKLDIEGAEVPALSGARETLRRFKPRLAIAGYHRHDDSVRIPDVVRQANPGYRSRAFRCRFDLGHNHPLTLFFE